MNKNKLIREGMVFGIIILFVGASVASGISAHNSINYSYNKETTEPEKFIQPDMVDLSKDYDGFSIELQNIRDTNIITYHIEGFTAQKVLINNKEYCRIVLGDESNIMEKGMPDLPSICRSIIIPDTEKMAIRITDSRYEQYEGISVVPSKGNLFRNVDPDDIPYEFDEIYIENTWFPQETAELDEPFILRDFRGQVVRINPFQYNPLQKQLRFYTDITVEIYPMCPDAVNCFIRDEPLSKIDADFQQLYKNHFINFKSSRYTPVVEQGNMLVITNDSFWDAMVPFIQWKNIKGIHTEMVDVSEIGDADDIKNYIADYYNNNGLTFVLLVGDAAQVPTIMVGSRASDPSYSYIVGDDHYPDLYVGRFSAETIDQVETQVERTIEYEQFPQTNGTWYHKGTGIASNQGPGDDGEYDWRHIRNIRTDLIGYFYTIVDELYDASHGGEDASGNPTSGMVSNVINDGRSIINYCGHGTTTRWSTSGFSNNNVNALTNDNKLPFIISVGCNNGNFLSTTCFAETWLRATHNNEPTGAIAVFMSSKPQLWNPPMDAQDEIVDILIESYIDKKETTFGGLSFSGCIHMNDQYGSQGYAETDAWHVFGDPSLQIRTDTPDNMTVLYDPIIHAGSLTFEVDVPGVENALCALSRNYTLLGYEYTDASGHALIQLDDPLGGIGNVNLVVTAYNKIPYITEISVIRSADLIITDFSARKMFRITTHITPYHNVPSEIKIKATIKNNGTAGVTTPFKVSFFKSKTNQVEFCDSNQIGMVKIPSLSVGETAEAIIFWKPKLGIHVLSVYADSGKVIDESVEDNNWASLILP